MPSKHALDCPLITTPLSGFMRPAVHAITYICRVSCVHAMEQLATLLLNERDNAHGFRMSKAVNDSRVTVVVCKPGESDCSNGDTPAPVKVSKWMRPANMKYRYRDMVLAQATTFYTDCFVAILLDKLSTLSAVHLSANSTACRSIMINVGAMRALPSIFVNPR